MAFNTDIVSTIDQRTKDIVNGYIKTVNKSLFVSTDNPYYNIPSGVLLICLIYYFDPEYFEKLGNDIKVSMDKKISTHTSDGAWTNNSFGHQWINSQSNDIIKWTFKILQCYGHSISIGISSVDNDTKRPFYFNERSSNYSIRNGGGQRKGKVEKQVIGNLQIMEKYLV